MFSVAIHWPVLTIVHYWWEIKNTLQMPFSANRHIGDSVYNPQREVCMSIRLDAVFHWELVPGSVDLKDCS